MTEMIRVTPREARERVLSRSAMLVCAYDDDEKFRLVQLEGAISLNEFKSRLLSLDKDKEIIFYCA
jgi:hypothetical protein